MSLTTLHSLGIEDTKDIERYTLRTEAEQDILKVYYKKQKGELFSRSEKFKFARLHRAVRDNQHHGDYNTELNEIAPILTKAMAELDEIVSRDRSERDIKEKIIADLRHLEKVVANKISEIKADLKDL